MLVAMEGKTKIFSFRVPADLAGRLERIKLEQAHKRVPNSEFLVEAVRLYVEHAEQFGIDDNLMVNEPDRPYNVKKPATRGTPGQKKTGTS